MSDASPRPDYGIDAPGVVRNCGDVGHVESRAGAILTTMITMGSLRPAQLVARKDATV